MYLLVGGLVIVLIGALWLAATAAGKAAERADQEKRNRKRRRRFDAAMDKFDPSRVFGDSKRVPDDGSDS